VAETFVCYDLINCGRTHLIRTDMKATAVIYALYIAFGALFLCLLANYLWKVRLRRQHLKLYAASVEAEPPCDLASDPFYCIFLKDGTSRSGTLAQEPRTQERSS